MKLLVITKSTVYRLTFAKNIPNLNSKKIEFKQDDISTSVKHTLRGLHGDNKTWKLVSCVYGSLLQVVVDMRESSDTYLEYDMFSINDKNRNQILIPPGFANGHLVMSDFGIFSYKQSVVRVFHFFFHKQKQQNRNF